MSAQPECEQCGSTNIEYWEVLHSQHDVIGIAGNEIRIGKQTNGDCYESGFQCADCSAPQPALDDYERDFLS